REALICEIVELLQARTIYVWKRGGEWNAEENPDLAGNMVYFRAGVYVNFMILGIPMKAVTLSFDASEFDLLACVLFLNSCVAWKCTDDLYLVPEKGNYIITFDSD